MSSAGMFRSKPIWPVAQKTQPIAHPAWVEMQTVERGVRPGRGYCMRTVSTVEPPGEGEKRLGGLAVVARDLAKEGGRVERESSLAHALAQVSGELRDGVEGVEAAPVESLQDLVGAVGGVRRALRGFRRARWA